MVNKAVRVRLYDLINQHFNEEEIRTLSFKLGVDYGVLGGYSKADRVRELVMLLDRSGRLHELVEACRRERPKVRWSVATVTLAEIPRDEHAAAPPRTHTTLKRYRWPAVVATTGLTILVVIVWAGSRPTGVPTPSASPTPTTPEWARITPTAILPDNIVIVSGNLSNCAQPTNLTDGLSHALESVNLGGRRFNVQQFADAYGDQLLKEAKRLGAVVTVGGECIDTQTWIVTVTFTAPSAHPVSLLNEPTELKFRAAPAHAEILVQGCVLYAVGQYKAVSSTLESLARAYTDAPDPDTRVSFFWLWGNTLLRLEDWPGTLGAYSQVLNNLASGDPRIADLLANRGLASLLAALAGGDTMACGIQSRGDLEDAVGLAPNRPDLHVLLGTIMLHCPLDDQDIEENAGRQVDEALKHDPNCAAAYALKAQVGEKNQANNTAIGGPLLIQRDACKALELDETLPAPHQTLGLIYAHYGLTDRARQEFEEYARSATLEWQRQDALKLWNDPGPAKQTAPPGLGQCE